MRRQLAELGDEDRERIVARYSARFEKYGVDLRTLNAGKGNKLRLQHEVHASIGDLGGATVLDLGCGLASYYDYLRSTDIDLTYIGYDIVPGFVEADRARFPEATFELRDVSKDEITHRADYAVMCQVFNNRYSLANNDDVVRRAVTRAFEAVAAGVSIDLRTTYVNYEDPDMYHYSPEQMFEFAKSLTPFVKLRHDYLPYDFTLMLYKQATMLWE